MTPSHKTVDEVYVILSVLVIQCSNKKYWEMEDFNEAKSALLELVLGCRPEKKIDLKPVGRTGAVGHVFEASLDEFESNIRKVFGEEQ